MLLFKELNGSDFDHFYKKYFRFDKKSIENKNWALLKHSSKSVYPSIAYHRNRKSGVSFPSQETISITSGRDLKTIREGIRGLVNFPGMESYSYVTRRGRRSTKYIFTEPPFEKGRVFHFHNILIEGGNWRCLTPTAKALYPVMRYFSYFDFEMYAASCLDSVVPPVRHEINDQTFNKRQYEFCEAEKDVLAEYSGISLSSVYTALKDLEKRCLIQPIDSENFKGWWVYLKPPSHYGRDYLNSEIERRLLPANI